MPMNPRLLRPHASGFDPRSISGLLAWWKFDEEAVNTNVNATDSVGGYTLTAASAPMAATGRTGRARRLRAGTNLYNTPAGIAGFSRATTGSTPLVAQDQSMTFAVWLKPEYAINTGGTSSTPMSLTFRSIGGLDQVRLAGGSVPSYAQQVTARAYYSDGSFASAFCPGVFSTFLPEGVWTHVAVVIDRAGQSLTIYKNGVSAVSSALNAAKVLDGISPGCGVTNFSFPGLVDDAVLYGRALTVSEVGRLAGAPQKPTAVSSLHIEAEVWAGRVIGSGGSVSLATAQAVSDFCTAIDAAGIRDRFYRLNLFCGSNLTAALVPLYRGPSLSGTQYGSTADTGVNFVSGDYSESQGLSSAVAGKVVNTGLASSSMPANVGHLAWSMRDSSFVASGFAMGFNNVGGYRSYCFLSNAASSSMGAASANTVEVVRTSSSIYARHIINRSDSTTLAYYRNGASSATTATTATATSGGADQLSIFGSNATSGARAGMHYYSAGDSMNATQAAAFDAAISQFLAALGRT